MRSTVAAIACALAFCAAHCKASQAQGAAIPGKESPAVPHPATSTVRPEPGSKPPTWDAIPLPTETVIPDERCGSLAPQQSPQLALPDPPLHTDEVLTRGVSVNEAECKALATALWLRV